MKCHALVQFPENKPVVFELTPLEVIRIVATRYGFDDVDMEPGVNNVKVTLSGGRSEKTYTAPDLYLLRDKVVSDLLT